MADAIPTPPTPSNIAAQLPGIVLDESSLTNGMSTAPVNQNAPQAPSSGQIQQLYQQAQARKQAIMQAPQTQQLLQQAFQPEAPVPEKPNEEYRSSLDVFKNLAPALAILGGSLTKHPLMNAMAAATGAMEGFNKGDKQRVDLAMDKYKDALTEWKLKHEQINDLQGKIIDKDGNVNYNELAAWAAAHGNQGMLAALQEDPEKALKWYMDYNKNQIEMDKNIAETKKYLADAKKAETASQATISPDVARLKAQQMHAGDYQAALTNLGRGTQGAANLAFIQNTFSEMYPDMTGDQLASVDQAFKAGQREQNSMAGVVGTLEGKQSIYGNVVQQSAQEAKDRSHEVNRSGFLPFGEIENRARAYGNDSAYGKLVVATNTLLRDYTQATAPGGKPTVDDYKHSYELLSTANDQQSFDARIDEMLKEVERTKKGTQNAKKEMFGKGDSSGGSSSDSTPQVPQSLSGKNNIHYSASRNQFKDMDTGKVYDVSGNPVK